jgi:hypothetical protein
MDVLRSARGPRMERIKNEHIKKIMGVKGKPDIIEKERLQWYGHVKRIPEENIPKLIMEWIPEDRRKNVDGRSTSSHDNKKLKPVQWKNREKWPLVSERRRQLLQNRIDRQ